MLTDTNTAWSQEQCGLPQSGRNVKGDLQNSLGSSTCMIHNETNTTLLEAQDQTLFETIRIQHPTRNRLD